MGVNRTRLRRWPRWWLERWVRHRPPLTAVAVCVGLVLILSACPQLVSAMAVAQATQPSRASRSSQASQPPKPSEPSKRSKPAPAPARPGPRGAAGGAAPERPPSPARTTAKAPPAAESAAISALVQAYFTALNNRDVDAAFRLWSQTSPEYGPVRQAMPVMLERVRPEWSGVWTRVMSIEQGRALARVHYSLTRTYQRLGSAGSPTSPTSAPEALRSVLAFAREGGAWRITSEKPESQYLAELLLNARDDAGVKRIVEEERSAITLPVIRILMGISSNSAAMGRHDLAVRGYERAVRLAEAPVAPLTDTEREQNMADLHLAGALLGLAGVHTYRPQPDPVRAIDLYERALVLYRKADAQAGVSDALQGLATAYYSAGDYASALERYQQVLPIVTAQRDQAGYARAQVGIGHVQYMFGQYDPALAAYGEALSTYRAMNDVDSQPRVLEGFGRVFAAVGDFAQSRARYQEALNLLLRTTNKSEQASVQLALATLSFQEGQFEDAKALDEQARQAAASVSDRVTEGRALFALGLVHSVQGEFDRAIEKYTEAYTAFMTPAPTPNIDSAGQTLIARGFTRIDQGDFVRALEDFTASVPLFEKGRNREGLARAYLGLATTHVRRADAKAALAAAGRAKALAEQSLSLDLLWQTDLESGRASRLANDEAGARQGFEEAIRVLEGARFEVSGEAEGQAPAQRVAPYVALAEWHIARNDPIQALIVAEGAKRRLLEDLLRPFRFRMTRGLTPERQADERRLVSLRTSLLKQVRRERDLATPNAARLAGLERAMTAARAETAEWNEAVARDLPSLVYLRGEAPFASLDALDAALPAGAALVHFLVGDERTSVIVATRRGETGVLSSRAGEGNGAAPASASASPPSSSPAPTLTGAPSPATAGAQATVGSQGGSPPSGAGAGATTAVDALPAPERIAERVSGGLDVFAYTIPVMRKQLADRVWRFTDGIAAKAETVAADARALHTLLLAPAAERLAGRSSLVIVPDDLLWGLPFEALMPADDRYLIEQSRITLIPSSAAWLSRPAETPARPLMAWPAAGELSDISPLQSRMTMATADRPPARPDSVSSSLRTQTQASPTTARGTSSTPPPAPGTPAAGTQAAGAPAPGTQAAGAPAPGTQAAGAQAPVAPSPGVQAPIAEAAIAQSAASPPSPSSESPTAQVTTIATWELFDLDLATEELVAVDIRPKMDRLRLDAGRLGATGFFWAAQSAGARRVIVSRRPPPPDVPTTTMAPLPHPHDWATWLVIGPPVGASPQR